jgi:hypothetical protein
MSLCNNSDCYSFIHNPNFIRPIYRAILPTHPQLATFEHDALTLMSKLAQNPLVISTVTACMYYPRTPGMWGSGQKHPPAKLGSFAVLYLSLNNEKFLHHALPKTSCPIHLDISSHPIHLLTTTPPSVHRALGPLLPGEALVGEGGQGTFGAYLYPTRHSPGEENVVWGLTCGHVASSRQVTSHLRKDLYLPSIHEKALSNESFEEYKRRQMEPVAEIDASHHNQPLYSPSIHTIDAILSDTSYNNFDIQQIKLKTLRDEASDSKTKALFTQRLNDLEERKKRCTVLEQVKRNPSLSCVGTVYRGEHGHVPESAAFLPATTSDPGCPDKSKLFQSQPMEVLESSCSEPTVAELRMKSLILTDWLLLKVERPVAEMVHPWTARPGDIVPGLPVTFMSGNHDNLLHPQRKGTVNGMKVHIVDHGVITSEWAVYPRNFQDGFAKPGDLGGIIIDEDFQPIALIFAGHPAAPYVFVKPLSFLLDRVELVTGMQMEFRPRPTQTGSSMSVMGLPGAIIIAIVSVTVGLGMGVISLLRNM